MNKSPINKTRILLMGCPASAFVTTAVLLAVAGLRAQSPTPVTDQFKEQAKVAFTAALTRASRPGESDFRKKLLLDAASAKKTVEEEGKITFPKEWVIMFYEPTGVTFVEKRGELLDLQDKLFENRENENYHIFYLSPANDGRQHKYEQHLMCCYKPWRPPQGPRP